MRASMRRHFLSSRGIQVASAAMALAAILFAGCGGGSDSGASAAPEGEEAVAVKTGSLSKAAFVSKANAVCEEGKAKLDKVYTAYVKRHPLSANSNDTEKAEWAGLLLSRLFGPEWEGEIEKIASLGVAASEEADVASFLTRFQRGTRELETHPNAFFEPAPFSEATQFAKKLGLTGCVQSLGG
jgi:hypothetical protein